MSQLFCRHRIDSPCLDSRAVPQRTVEGQILTVLKATTHTQSASTESFSCRPLTRRRFRKWWISEQAQAFGQCKFPYSRSSPPFPFLGEPRPDSLSLPFSDFADKFPNAEVIGTDVSPIQPSWVPPNVKFELDDCNKEWTWPDNTFDFIHIRFLVGVVEDWYKLFRQAYRTCKPGGYVESFTAEFDFHSDDGSVKPNSALDQWGKVFSEGGKKFGRTFNVYQDDLQRKGMEAAGFTDIEFKDIIVPIGVWHPDKKAAEVGLWFKMTLEMDMEGYLNYVFNTLMGWTPEETKLFAAHARKEWNDPNIHGYGMARVVWGRKPEAPE